MNRHLLTRRGHSVLVASLAVFGIAGTTNAFATTVSVSNGVLSINDPNGVDNSILVTRLSDNTNGTCLPSQPSCSASHQRIRVQDQSALPTQKPSDFPVAPPGAGAGGLAAVAFGPNCAADTDPNYPNAAICTSDTATFTRLVATLAGGDDILAPTAHQTADPTNPTKELRLPPFQLDGGDGHDILFGTDYTDDSLTGGAGDDDLYGGRSNITSGGGDDTFAPGAGGGRVVGGSGTDTVDYSDQSADVRVDLDGDPNDGPGCVPATRTNCANIGTDVENVKTGSGNDLVIAQSDLPNNIDTGAGSDFVYGNGGNDTVDAGAGDNTVDTKDLMTSVSSSQDVLDASVTKAGDDTINAGDGANTVTTGDGTDRVTLGNGANTVTEGNGNGDSVTTGSGLDTITVGTGNGDGIDAGAGNNVINVGAGAVSGTSGSNPSIATGGGDDSITVGDGNGVKVSDGGGTNTVTVGGGANNVSGRGITTGDGNDTITTGNGGDLVNAGNGANTVTTGDGTDNVSVGNGSDTVKVNGGNDTVNDGGGTNTVFGGAGNDGITTGGGVDTVYGQDGDDTIKTNAGNDYIQGGAGADDMDGGADSDTVDYSDKTTDLYLQSSGGNPKGQGAGCTATSTKDDASCEHDSLAGFENVVAGTGNDVVVGDGNANTLVGEGGNDTLDGGTGDDVLYGDQGTVNGKDYALVGTPGDDVLKGGAGGDEIHGGADRLSAGGNGDSVSYDDTQHNSGVNVSLDGTRNDGSSCPGSSCENDNIFGDIENVTGSPGNDTLTGSDGPNKLDGVTGDDSLDGKGGPDVLIGGPDATSSPKGDTVTYASRSEDVNATIDLGTTVPSLGQCAGYTGDQSVCDDGAAGEHDYIANSVENLKGGAGNDTLAGNDRDNLLIGGAGDDSIDGKLGADSINGGDGNDTAVYDRAAGDTVVVTINNDNDDGNIAAGGENDNVHTDVENVTGGAEKDIFSGNQQVNVLRGGAGNDTLDGLQGNDVLLGGAGADQINGSAGDDLLDPGADDGSADDLQGGGGTDTADYHGYTSGTPSVTFDDVANDGVGSEGDNAHEDIELKWLPGQPDPRGGDQPQQPQQPQPDPQPQPGTQQQQQQSSAGDTSTDTSSTDSSSSTQSSSVTTTTTPRDDSAQSTAVALGKAKSVKRTALIQGRILVRSRSGVAKSASACAGGGMVKVTITKGTKVVGTRYAPVSKTCTFRAPVTLAKGITGKLNVEVKFLGNRALKPSKRTTKLQVNG